MRLSLPGRLIALTILVFTLVGGPATANNEEGIFAASPSIPTRVTQITSQFGNPCVLTGIEVDETAGEARVTLEIEGIPDYSVATAVREGHKWIDLNLRRFRRAVLEIPEEGRNIAGRIVVMSDPDRGDIRVSIQILPAGVDYDVFREGSSLVIRLVPRLG